MEKFRGVFDTVNDAMVASKQAFRLYSKLSINDKENIIKQLRLGLSKHIDDIANMTYIETGMGKVEDKKLKLKLAIEQTPGIEDLVNQYKSGDGGSILVEYSPYGIACAIHPSTNPCETIINNTISLLASSNVVVNCPHPRAIGVSKYLTNIMNKILFDTCNIENLVVTINEPSLQVIKEIMNNPDVDLIVSTGGSDNARSIISCGKKVIAAGPANPTFIVDDTADIDEAVCCIIKGATFDNNIMCITEKNIIVDEKVIDKFRDTMKQNGVYYTNDIIDMLKLSKLLLTEDCSPNKLWGGKDVNLILESAGIKVDRKYQLIAVETIKIHPFVTKELLMPLVSVIVAKDFEDALDIGLMAEQNLRHTAGIHSNRVDRLRRAEQEFKTSIFVKNGSSLDGIGICGVGGTSYTIANVSGEGFTSAKDFSRKRRSVMVDYNCL